MYGMQQTADGKAEVIHIKSKINSATIITPLHETRDRDLFSIRTREFSSQCVKPCTSVTLHG